MCATVVSPTRTTLNMTPEYEVKLLLNSAVVLGFDKKLTNTVLSTFNMPSTVTKLNVQFLDKVSREIYYAGWSPRIRKIESEDDFELTYMKRYVVTGGDIDAALTAANNDGFDATDAKYDAQVEWGYQKQTSSVSRKKTATGSGNSRTDLPGTNESRAMLIDKAPNKFDNYGSRNWGTGALATSRIFGPILTERSIGMWNGMPLYIKVWPILNQASTGVAYIVEASFKTKSHATAKKEREVLIAYLQDKGWLLPQDSLKTQLIMERS